jgi:hypothetical protein
LQWSNPKTTKNPQTNALPTKVQGRAKNQARKQGIERATSLTTDKKQEEERERARDDPQLKKQRGMKEKGLSVEDQLPVRDFA